MVFPVGTSPGSRPSSIGRTGALVFAMFRCVRSKSKEIFSSLRREGAHVALLRALLPVVLVTGWSAASFGPSRPIQYAEGSDEGGEMPVGREVLGKVGVLCVFALVLGTLAGCGGSDNEDEQEANEPTREPVEETTTEAAAEGGVVVRVSGTPGTAYSGTYGTTTEVQAVDDATVETEPTNYEVGGVGGAGDRLNTSFSKTEPGGETLEIEIVVDGEPVARGETSAELGVATASWTPAGTLQDETLPKEREK